MLLFVVSSYKFLHIAKVVVKYFVHNHKMYYFEPEDSVTVYGAVPQYRHKIWGNHDDSWDNVHANWN